nr:MAG: hypothetical protein DIU56_08035 [Pseudomonadota bacterium]
MRATCTIRALLGGIAAISLLTACPAPPRQEAGKLPGAAPQTFGFTGPERTFRISPPESLVTVLVYRGGPLAAAGHNHVVASHDVSGTVRLHPELARSAFGLELPVASLIVDDPEMRREAGPEFPPEVPDSAREGTRRNMLSEAVLDAGRSPVIRVRSDSIVPGSEGLTARIRVNLRGRDHVLDVPVSLELSGDELRAAGEVTVSHAQLGLTPFSVLLGALRVRDDLTIRYRIVARPVDSHSPRVPSEPGAGGAE